MVMHSDVDIFVGALLEDVRILQKRCTRLESVLEQLVTNMSYEETKKAKHAVLKSMSDELCRKID